MDDDEWSIFWGFGSTHDLNDAGPEHRPPSRLNGLKSVSDNAEWAYRQKPKLVKRHPIGFHKPRTK